MLSDQGGCGILEHGRYHRSGIIQARTEVGVVPHVLSCTESQNATGPVHTSYEQSLLATTDDHQRYQYGANNLPVQKGLYMSSNMFSSLEDRQQLKVGLVGE
jgi:hypothetical protein